MDAACANPRPGRISQNVIWLVTTTQSQRNCASTFQPVSSMCASALRRAASRSACQVASALRAVRWIARQIPLRLMLNPKPCCRMAAASACGNPCSLFISTPRVTASGPTAPPRLRSHRRFGVDAAPARASHTAHTGRWECQNAVPTSGARSLPDIAARSALRSTNPRMPDTAPEAAPESPHPLAPGRADGDVFHSGRPACDLGISDDSCAGLAKTEPPDAGPRAARPLTPFASAQSLPVAAYSRSLDAAYPVAPDPVAPGRGVAPAPVL